MIFDYSDYKDIILSKIEDFSHIKGYRSKLAEAAQCQRSVISQVLNNKSSHLSLEQGMYLAKFWSFDTTETSYFLNLINLARAGNKTLKTYYQEQVLKQKKQIQDFSKRFDEKSLDDLSKQTLYYSHWNTSTIHVLLSIEKYRTPKAIASRLGISLIEVEEILKVLEKLKLAAMKGQEWVQTVNFLHLPKSSPLTVVNHMNWRQRAISSMHDDEDINMFFSSVFSCSAEGVEKIKKAIQEAIDSARKTVKSSDAEEAYSLNFDLFKL